MESNERVHFYSANDLSLGWQIPRINKLISVRSTWSFFTDINDVIELYETQKVLEIGAVKYQENDEILSNIKRVLGKNIGQIDSSSINSILEQVDSSYKDAFWELLTTYGAYRRIDSQSFEMLTQSKAFNIVNVLHQKKLTIQFDNEIGKYLKNNMRYTNLLINKYLENDHKPKNEIYFPQSFTVQDRVDLLWQYIGSHNIGINELELISKTRGNNELPISPEMRLAAKCKHKERLDTLLQGAPIISFGANVVFKMLPDDISETHHFKDGIIQTEYNIKWIKENLDYPTLLNNFIYLFGYTDRQFRWTHISKIGNIGVIEKMIGMKGKREYPIGTAFTTVELLGNSQIHGYSITLKRLGIDIERIIRWFFVDYLSNEFNAQGFLFNVSSDGTNDLEKCRNLVIEIDSILKQFILYCKNRRVDWDLFEISTEHMFINNVPSLLKEKYLYSSGDDFHKAAFILFSDQSIAYYIKGKTNQYSSFYEALKHTTINKSELKTYQIGDVDWLISKGILVLSENGDLNYDKALLWLMQDLYFNECAGVAYLNSFQEQIAFLQNQGMIRYGSTLLSEPEQHYFNYIFNSAEYDNSLDLRNKYAHGSKRPDAEIDQNNYYIILRMLILITIKINEEFCLYEENENINKEEINPFAL